VSVDRADLSPPSSAPPELWTGRELLLAFTAATRWLGANRERVNALNVFPVPDGDTGTNMALTMNAALAAAEELESEAQANAADVASRIAHGALMGARGNSGVILSQVFRGIAQGIEGRKRIDGRDLATALSRGKEMAYKAVMNPVEGTMLTVVGVASEQAEAAARESPAVSTMLSAALSGAADALIRTPEQLDILRQAGVVDAGGQGIVLILEGMNRFAEGETVPSIAEEIPHHPGLDMHCLDRVEELHGGDEFGYCTNFIVFGKDIDVDRCREDIAAMGTSAVIVGDDTVLKIHVHVANPGKVLDYGINLGDLDQIKIENMQVQTRELTAQRAKDTRSERQEAHQKNGTAPPGRHAILAVAPGEGLADALRSMGATDVITGGQTMNPSIEELLAAVEGAGYQQVIVLPNNPNIVLTAKQLPDLTAKEVGVVPTRSVPQAIAALGAYNMNAGCAETVEAMTEALTLVRTVELTKAVRDAEINGVRVTNGQTIGMLDGQLVAAGADMVSVCLRTLDAVDMEDHELITVFSGAGTTRETAAALAESLRSRFPAMNVEIHHGGQPHYDFVIAIE
jgi:DAK2 domain fusion protein YloV